jgi:hypothetical protein
MPKHDSIQQFVALRAALEKERAALQKRLTEIDQVLAGTATPTAAPRRAGRRAASPAKAPRKRSSRRAVNAVTLREAIARATAHGALSVRDVVNAVKKSGYRFKSANPVNSVGAYLYGPEGKKHFKRANGKFSPK